MAGYRVVDIETVPDLSVWTPPDLRYALAPRGPFMAPPDADLSDPASLVAPAGVMLAEQFPPAHAHRVVAMSWVDMVSDDERYYHFERYVSECTWSHTEPAAPEKARLQAFNDAQNNDRALVVTWNGRGFDLPVIAMRSFMHAVSMGWYYGERNVRYRYTDAGHCDLMDFLSDYGAGRQAKLGDIARLIKLPGKTGEISGHNVAAQYARGDDEQVMAQVADYCLSDTMQTAILFVRSRYHKGMLNSKEYNAAIASFVDSKAIADALGESYDPSPLFI